MFNFSFHTSSRCPQLNVKGSIQFANTIRNVEYKNDNAVWTNARIGNFLFLIKRHIKHVPDMTLEQSRHSSLTNYKTPVSCIDTDK